MKPGKYSHEHEIHLPDSVKTELDLIPSRDDLEEYVLQDFDTCKYFERCKKICSREKEKNCQVRKFWDKHGKDYV